MKPITPDEVGLNKVSTLPSKVIEAFNQLITENAIGGVTRVEQSDVLDRIAILMNVEFTSPKAGPAWGESAIKKGWLNVEDMYRAVGWKVLYHGPSYDENCKPFFVFSRT